MAGKIVEAADPATSSDKLWAEGIVDFLRHKTIETFISAVNACPSADGPAADSERHCFLGTLRLLRGQLSEAEDCFSAAIACAPDDRHCHLELMLLLHSQGRHEDARAMVSRAITSCGGWSDPWQRPPMFVAGLRSKSFWANDDFPWASDLESAFSIVRGELEEVWTGAAIQMPKGSQNENRSDEWEIVGGTRGAGDADIIAPGGDWRELVLFGADGNDGRKTCCQSMPKTRALLEQLVPDAVNMARIGAGEIILSALQPGTRLVPHCASSNNRLTCHLGLVCPEGPRLRVGEDWATWREGKCLFFDDSFEHEVEHEGSAVRIVLLIRFWHPDLPQDRQIPSLEEGIDQFEQMQRRRSYPPMSKTVENSLVAFRAGGMPREPVEPDLSEGHENPPDDVTE